MHDYPREITKMIRGYGDNTQINSYVLSPK